MEAQNDSNVALQNSFNASNIGTSADLSSSAINVYKFPPGYRFRPTDKELVIDYLRRKVRNEPLPPNHMVVVDLYDHNPKYLAETYKNLGEDEWYFFTSRTRKYPNGKRPNRSTSDGYWKATGADKLIEHEGIVVGCKKSLVFYLGQSPSGVKTNWIMHEFKINEPPRTKEHEKDMKLDDWVLCKIYEKIENPLQNKRKNQTQFDEDGNNGGDHMEVHFESNDVVFNSNNAHVEYNVTNDGNQILPGMAHGYNNEVPNIEDSNEIYDNFWGNLEYNSLAPLMAPQDISSIPQNNTMPIIIPNHNYSNNYLEDVVRCNNLDNNNLGSMVNWDNNTDIVPNQHHRNNYLEDVVHCHNPDSNNLGFIVNWDNNPRQVDQWGSNMSSTLPLVSIPTNYTAPDMTLDEYIQMLQCKSALPYVSPNSGRAK